MLQIVLRYQQNVSLAQRLISLWLIDIDFGNTEPLNNLQYLVCIAAELDLVFHKHSALHPRQILKLVSPSQERAVHQLPPEMP